MVTAKRRLSYPERLVLGHERRGTIQLGVAAVACVVAATLASVSSAATGVGPVLVAVVMLVRARRHFGLARRAEIGVNSERETNSALSALQRRGWTVEANVVFPGRGDIDHVVKVPGGPYFAIETKTTRFNRRDLDRTVAVARFVAGRGRHHVPTFAILTTAAKRGTSLERGVIVCWTRNLVSVIDKECRAYRAGA